MVWMQTKWRCFSRKLEPFSALGLLGAWKSTEAIIVRDESKNCNKSRVERRPGSHPRTASDKRAAIYVDYSEDLSKPSGTGINSSEQKESNMADTGADERTPLLQEKTRLKCKIIEEVSRVDAVMEAQTNSLLQNADNLSAAADKYFGEDKKIRPKKQPCWKQLCCCCGK